MALGLSDLTSLDLMASVFVASLRRPWLTKAMRLATSLGSSFLCLPAYAAVCLYGHGLYSELAGMCLFAEITMLPMIILVRCLTRRERPSPREVNPWAPWDRFSFPSHHAARVWMLAVILAACIPQARGVMYIIAALVSVSRLYLQKHYLTDVIAGVVLGICFGAVANVLYPGGCGVNLP